MGIETASEQWFHIFYVSALINLVNLFEAKKTNRNLTLAQVLIKEKKIHKRVQEH